MDTVNLRQPTRPPETSSSSDSSKGYSRERFGYQETDRKSAYKPKIQGGQRTSAAPDMRSTDAPTPHTAAGLSNGTTFRVGERVRHAKFGDGTISQILGEGDKAIYSIQFDRIQGKKLLDPKFAKLEPV